MVANWASEVLTTSRQRAGVSQRALARKTGIAHSTICHIEAGSMQPSIPILEHLIRGCGSDFSIMVTPKDGRWSAADAADVAKRWSNQDDEDSAIRAGIQLRDDLSSSSTFRLLELVADEPNSIGNNKLDAMIAAVVHEACVNHKLEIPGWVGTLDRCLSELVPLWPMSENAMLLARRSTPAQFINHGLIASRRDLTSV